MSRLADIRRFIGASSVTFASRRALVAPTAEAAWSALMGSDLIKVVVADAAGMLISTCTLVTIPNLTRGVRPYGLIENVVTHPDHRRTGLGRAVLSFALAAAWKAGCYRVMLATGSRREETLRRSSCVLSWCFRLNLLPR